MPTLSGTGNLFGSGLTLVTGDQFRSDMVGALITVHAHNYHVAAVQDGSNLTLDDAIEIFPDAPWSCTIADPPPPDPDPLMLSCFCPGDTGVAGCQLLSLTLRMVGNNIDFPGKSCIGAMSISMGNPTYTITDTFPTPGPFTTSYPLNLLAYYSAWDSIFLTLGGNSTLFQIDPTTTALNIWYEYYIDEEWICFNPDTHGADTVHIRAIDQECGCVGCVNCDGPNNACIILGGGEATYSKTTSTTLSGAARFCSVLDFTYPPTQNLLNAPQNSLWCLCPSGGVPPYVFSIVAGELPCGEELNRDTGCITGAPTGDCPGSPQVTFRVFDQNGSHADVTCNLIVACPGLNPDVSNWAA